MLRLAAECWRRFSKEVTTKHLVNIGEKATVQYQSEIKVRHAMAGRTCATTWFVKHSV